MTLSRRRVGRGQVEAIPGPCLRGRGHCRYPHVVLLRLDRVKRGARAAAVGDAVGVAQPAAAVSAARGDRERSRHRPEGVEEVWHEADARSVLERRKAKQRPGGVGAAVLPADTSPDPG